MAATGSTTPALASTGVTDVVVDTGVSGPEAAANTVRADRAAGRTLCTRWLRSGAAVAGARVSITVLASIWGIMVAV